MVSRRAIRTTNGWGSACGRLTSGRLRIFSKAWVESSENTTKLLTSWFCKWKCSSTCDLWNLRFVRSDRWQFMRSLWACDRDGKLTVSHATPLLTRLCITTNLSFSFEVMRAQKYRCAVLHFVGVVGWCDGAG